MKRSSLAREADLFAALGDETRLRIVARLSSDGPQSIASLTEEARVTRQAVTKHLDALEDAGIVRGSRDGRARIFEIRPKRLAEARTYLERISARWDHAIERLRKLVED